MLFCLRLSMKEKIFSRSQRKYIRRQKAKIRREIFDLEKQRQAIEEFYKGLFAGPKTAAEKPTPKQTKAKVEGAGTEKAAAPKTKPEPEPELKPQAEADSPSPKGANQKQALPGNLAADGVVA